jgi:hypothetical protein
MFLYANEGTTNVRILPSTHKMKVLNKTMADDMDRSLSTPAITRVMSTFSCSYRPSNDIHALDSTGPSAAKSALRVESEPED